MPRDPRAWLSDVIAACDLLTDFTKGKNFDDYSTDAFLRSAVERQLEIVGEALRVAAQHRPDLAEHISELPAIVAFRNQLTHAYSAIDHRTVWGILERRVPQLRSEVERVLSHFSAEFRVQRVEKEEDP
jgi:uncharacterized protein with HEPN domain